MPDNSYLIIMGGIMCIVVLLAIVFVGGNYLDKSDLSANIGNYDESQGHDDRVTDLVTPNIMKGSGKNVTVSPSVSPLSPSVSPSQSPESSTIVSSLPSSTVTVSPTVSLTRTPIVSSTVTPTSMVTETPSPSATPTPDTGTFHVIFNEIAWMGTQASATDEWIELYNSGTAVAELAGWKILDGSGNVVVALSSTIDPGAYFLIERTDQQTIEDIDGQIAAPFGGGGLNNSGEKLMLLDNNDKTIDILDCSGGWFAGDKGLRFSMERVDLGENWATFNGIGGRGHDADGNQVNGTPGIQNSVSS